MEQLTTYRAKGKEIGLVFLFKYDLKGNLRGYEVVEEPLNSDQIRWLFTGHLPKDAVFLNLKEVLLQIKPNFPANETIMKTIWMKSEKYIKAFDVTCTPADISFDAFWKLYPYNKLSNKQTSKERFLKLKEAEVIKLFAETPEFIKLKKRENQFFPYAEVYIRSRWWDK